MNRGRQLAALGGQPAFAEPLHVGRPNIGDRADFLDRVAAMLDRRWFSNDGPFVKELEQRIAEYVGVGHCIAMCNATIALEIAARALGWRGEVIVPAYTFVASAHALAWQGITPVFADMDPETHNLDPADVERKITLRTTGILGVHVWGRPCDTDAIEAIGRRHRLSVMYDAAHAFGCSRRGRMIGGFGACEVFSFHATKFLNSFEGGAIVTNDDDLAARVRLMRNFGFAGFDNVEYLGVNGKMTEVCAAMGLASLASVDDLIAANRRNYDAYRRSLDGVPGLTVIAYDHADRCNYQYVVVQVDPDACALNRDELVRVLHAENVLARKYFWPGVHRMEPYRTERPNLPETLPVTERVAARIIVLPTGQTVTEEIVTRVSGIITQALEQSEALGRALGSARPEA